MAERPPGGGRVLPHSPQAEIEVVASSLADPRRIASAAAHVSPGDFYSRPLGAVWRSLVELDAAERPVDAIAVVEHMKAAGTIGLLRAVAGGEGREVEHLIGLGVDAIMASNIGHHAKQVRLLARRRSLVELLAEMREEGYRDGVDSQAFLDAVEQRVLEITTASQATRLLAWSEIMADVNRELERRTAAFADGGTALQGVRSGFDELDETIGGFRRGELIIIAARPSMGKSALMLECVLNAARRGAPGLIFSLEMSAHSLGERSVASGARIDSRALQRGQLDAKAWMRLISLLSRERGLPIHVDQTSQTSLAHVRSIARRWRIEHAPVTKHPEGIVALDYLQIMGGGDEEPRGRREQQTRDREIAGWTAGLKALAKDLDVPVIVLSQLNRGVEGRPDKRPRMADLRDSGAIEQDADVIAFIYRDEVYNKETTDRGVAEVIVEKNRNGATGTARLGFVKQEVRFENLAVDNERQRSFAPPQGHPAAGGYPGPDESDET